MLKNYYNFRTKNRINLGEVNNEINKIIGKRVNIIENMIKKFDLKKLLNELPMMRFSVHMNPYFSTKYFDDVSNPSRIGEYIEILTAFTCKYSYPNSGYFNEQEIKNIIKLIEDIYITLVKIDLLSIYLTEKKYVFNINGRLPLDFKDNKQYYAYQLLQLRTEKDTQMRYPLETVEETFESFKNNFKEFDGIVKNMFNLGINGICDTHKNLFDLIFSRKKVIFSKEEFEKEFDINNKYTKTLIIKNKNIDINFEYNFGWQTPIVEFSDFYFINPTDIIMSLHELDFRVMNNKSIDKKLIEKYKNKRSELFESDIVKILEAFGYSIKRGVDVPLIKKTKGFTLGNIDILARKPSYVFIIEAKSSRPDNLSKTLSAPNLFHKRLKELNEQTNRHLKRYEYILKNKEEYNIDNSVIIPIFITNYTEVISHYVNKDIVCLSLLEFKDWIKIFETENKILLTDDFFRKEYPTIFHHVKGVQ